MEVLKANLGGMQAYQTYSTCSAGASPLLAPRGLLRLSVRLREADACLRVAAWQPKQYPLAQGVAARGEPSRGIQHGALAGTCAHHCAILSLPTVITRTLASMVSPFLQPWMEQISTTASSPQLFPSLLRSKTGMHCIAPSIFQASDPV